MIKNSDMRATMVEQQQNDQPSIDDFCRLKRN